jgi:hypothetical protein
VRREKDFRDVYVKDFISINIRTPMSFLTFFRDSTIVAPVIVGNPVIDVS